MKGFLLGSLRALKFPVKLLLGIFKKKKKRTELEEKCWKHIRNFAPTHYSWQKSVGKKVKKKPKKRHTSPLASLRN